MNTKALVAVIAFVAAASAMAQFKSSDVHVASAGLSVPGLSLPGAANGSEGAGANGVRLEASHEAGSQMQGARSGESDRLSFPEPGNTAMLLAGLAVIGFVAARRQQS